MATNYQRWKYDSKSKGGQIEFEVTPWPEMKCNNFFKYYALTNNSIDALTKCYVYASHPNQFNDSFDCNSQILNFETASESDLHCFYGSYYHQFLESCGDKESLKKMMSVHFKEIAYRHIGLVSFASRNDSAYFWSVYSQDGHGFCVEYDVEKFPFRNYGPFPVNYVEKILRFDVCGNIPTALLIQTNVKTKAWENEQEWRLIVSNPEGLDFNSWGEDGNLSQQFNKGDEHDRKMRYPLEAIKSVILGERFFRSPSIRCYPITEDEVEVVFLNNKDELCFKVLDFLIGKEFALFMLKNNLGELIPYPIVIVKLQEHVYRIILN